MSALGSGGARRGAPLVIVGLGNEIAGDDGVGIWIAVCLRRLLRNQPQVEVVALPWAGFALIDVLRGRTRAAIVDCMQTGAVPPGTVRRLSERRVSGSVRLCSYHDIDFVTALALGRKLGWPLPAHIRIWGIEGERMSHFSTRLSPRVKRAAVRVMREILDEFHLSLNGANEYEPSSSSTGGSHGAGGVAAN